MNITLQVWRRPLASGSLAVVVFNRGQTPANLNLTWDMLGLKPGAKMVVRDLWKHGDISNFTDLYSVEALGIHDSAFLTFTSV